MRERKRERASEGGREGKRERERVREGGREREREREERKRVRESEKNDSIQNWVKVTLTTERETIFAHSLTLTRSLSHSLTFSLTPSFWHYANYVYQEVPKYITL